MDLRPPARPRRPATRSWTGSCSASAPRNGKVFQNTILDGEGATGKVTGAYATRGRQHLDFDTTQEHAAANCTSDLAFRGILADRSSAVWRGMIKVDPGAQQTDAFQESRNLLLSKKAHADAIPGLEILANDVRCTHAAAIAQIDPEQVFYLRSRGLPQEAAERLVVEGFLAELVERFEEGDVRDALAAALERRLAAVLGDRTVRLPRWAPLAAVVVVLAVQPVLGRLDYRHAVRARRDRRLDGASRDRRGARSRCCARRGGWRRRSSCSRWSSTSTTCRSRLGTDVLTAGTERPYTHSLLTMLVVLVAAGLRASRRAARCRHRPRRPPLPRPGHGRRGVPCCGRSATRGRPCPSRSTSGC